MHQVSSLTDHCPPRLEVECALNFEANAKYRFLVVYGGAEEQEEDVLLEENFPQLVEKKARRATERKQFRKAMARSGHIKIYE